jgi:hypothetical protein
MSHEPRGLVGHAELRSICLALIPFLLTHIRCVA